MKTPTIIEHVGMRVLSTQQLAESYGTSSDRISKNYSENKERYTEGKHFFKLEGQDLLHFRNSEPQFEISNMTRVIYLWTEKGAWMHAKSLNTDQAWDAYELLVDDYYAVKQNQLDVNQLSPELQMFKQIFDNVARKQLEDSQRDEKINQIENGIQTIKETFLHKDDDWRKSINSLLNRAAKKLDGNYRELRTKSYELLEERGKCNLSIRVNNLKQRLFEGGATKTQINKTTKMDVIEQDPRLKEIYSTIVKELSIGTI